MQIKNNFYIIPQHKSGRKLLGFLLNKKDPNEGLICVLLGVTEIR